MENEFLVRLDELKTLIYVLISIFSVGLLLIVTIFYFIGIRFLSYKKSDYFKFCVEEKLDKGLCSEVISDSIEFLKERPHHTYAQWYLAKAYYYTNNYENAKVYFKKILKSEPAWVDSVEPYLDEIALEEEIIN